MSPIRSRARMSALRQKRSLSTPTGLKAAVTIREDDPFPPPSTVRSFMPAIATSVELSCRPANCRTGNSAEAPHQRVSRAARGPLNCWIASFTKRPRPAFPAAMRSNASFGRNAVFATGSLGCDPNF